MGPYITHIVAYPQPDTSYGSWGSGAAKIGLWSTHGKRDDAARVARQAPKGAFVMDWRDDGSVDGTYATRSGDVVIDAYDVLEGTVNPAIEGTY